MAAPRVVGVPAAVRAAAMGPVACATDGQGYGLSHHPVVGESRAAQPLASGLGRGESLPRPSGDHRSLEFGEHRQHLRHRLAVWSAEVHPEIQDDDRPLLPAGGFKNVARLQN